jgi:hypothetical protein
MINSMVIGVAGSTHWNVVRYSGPSASKECIDVTRRKIMAKRKRRALYGRGSRESISRAQESLLLLLILYCIAS